MENTLLESVSKYWEEKIIPTLSTYIEIPAKSPSFDPKWKENGHIDKVMKLVDNWINEQKIPSLKKEIIEEKGRTPLLILDLPGDFDYNVLMYGHLDKQPEMTGWSEGLSPWKAVRKGEKLYGRGGADDGYAVFACVCAIQHLLDMKVKRPNIKVAIELSEESGSSDLPFYFETHSKKFGTPNLIICLDSGTGNYEQFWTTTSLRGVVNGTLKVQVLDEGVHSGDASGIVPSSFRIARQILDRIENVQTGEVYPENFKVEIPKQRMAQVEKTAGVLNELIFKKFPFTDKTTPVATSPKELLLNRTWRATLCITGAEGLPEILKGGSVLRPYTTLKLSLRLPPTLDAKKATDELKQILVKNPPYNAKVEFHSEGEASGWNAPPMNEKLEKIIAEASQKFYGKESLYMGEGGTIPFMGMLGAKFPNAQFVITGVLGPNSNAHGPNEFIHLEYAKKLNACITYILENTNKLI